jgi:hypothetical protein
MCLMASLALSTILIEITRSEFRGQSSSVAGTTSASGTSSIVRSQPAPYSARLEARDHQWQKPRGDQLIVSETWLGATADVPSSHKRLPCFV